MLQSSEIQKRFSHLQQTISEAWRTCHSDKSVPQSLVQAVDKLDKECQSAKSIMSSQDESQMRQCIDDLERIGDQAERACQSGSVDGKIMRAVSTMHSELSDLKKQLH